MVNGRGKSDSPVVPVKLPNKVAHAAAEAMEGRGLAKGNPPKSNTSRTQDRQDVPSAIERIRQAAQRDEKIRFTTLLHHVYDIPRLRTAYLAIRHDAAAGVDGVTWKEYGLTLEENLRDLSGRLQRGGYRAKPTKRVHIPKADGKLRALGIPALEDKIVQRAMAEVLNAIYEVDFLGFSYGFRRERSMHDALDALSVGLMKKKVNWVLDADIRSFYDTLNQEWLLKFVEHRVADKRVVRLIRKWLSAGVLEDGEHKRSDVGTVQGGSISPLLSNIYMHYVFDLWSHQWRNRNAHGDVVIVRYSEYFVVGFEHREEAERFLAELRERFARFGLELHPDKTRLIPFGRKAAKDWRDGDGDKPGTFNFLGFTHSCGKTRKGWFTVLRRTVHKRLQAKLREVHQDLRKRLHDPIPNVGAWLRSVLAGHFRYYGVPFNGPALTQFRHAVAWLWWKTLRRRSQTGRVTWERMQRLIDRWFPPASVCHPYPLTRFANRYAVTTQGKSRMR